MTEPATGAFHALLTESRTFPPSPEATAHGIVSDPGIYEAALPGGVQGRRVVMLEDMERTWRLSGEAGGHDRALTLVPQ